LLLSIGVICNGIPRLFAKLVGGDIFRRQKNMKCDEDPYKDACYENIDNKDDIHNEMTDTLTGQA
jgi:hypothetical protein